MQPQRSTEHAETGEDRETLECAILSLKLSLTAAWAHAQLLERRSRRGDPMTNAQVERTSGTIASACAEMTRAIREIEDELSQRGDATNATDR